MGVLGIRHGIIVLAVVLLVFRTRRRGNVAKIWAKQRLQAGHA